MTELHSLPIVLFDLGAAFVAIALMLSIAFALLEDDHVAAQERELARLTAPLPDVAAVPADWTYELVLDPSEPAPTAGRHRPGNAPGTDAQRRCDHTMEFAAVTA
jgi:hypothetical protein